MNFNDAAANAAAYANSLNLDGVREAIAICEINLEALKPEHRPGLKIILAALRNRERRLVATDQRIAAIRRAQ